MKKLLSLMIITLALALCGVATAYAVSAESNKVIHELGVVEFKNGEAEIQGTSPPSYGDTWNLGNGPYNFSFYFDSSVYSNKTLVTNTGTIKFTITSSPEYEHINNKTFTIELYRKNIIGGTFIDSKTCLRKGTTSGQFTGLDPNKQYFFKLVKPIDEIYLTGTGSLSQ